MDNDIKVFNHDHFGNIRTVEVNGHNWFVGNDVARVQYRSQNGVWVLYAKYQDLGYTKTRTFVIPDSATGRTVVIMYWTEAGRDFLYKFLKTKGILPRVISGSPSDNNNVSDKKYDQLSLY